MNNPSNQGVPPAAKAPEDRLAVAIARVAHSSSRDQLKERVTLALRLLFTKAEHKDTLEATARTVSDILRGLRTGLSLDQSSAEIQYAAQACVQILQDARRKVQPSGFVTSRHHAATPGKPAAATAEENPDVEYYLPPHLSHLLKRLDYVVPVLPPPEGGFPSFDKLCEAAICRRVDKVLVFFQRHNPAVVRELPPIFLTSPEFAEKFRAAIGKLVFPIIWESRQVRMLSTSFEWATADTDSFWEFVGDQQADKVMASWIEAWNELRLIEAKKEDGTRVFKVKDNTKMLREMLQPSSDTAYDLPKVGNREIEVFKSLLDPLNDWWSRLTIAWQACHDLYEQEKDPRVFQQKAREGAFRDNLLAAFQRFPDQWGDFLVLTCHRVFPRVSTEFLEKFSTNLGRNEIEREHYMPYLIRYLRQVREHPEIRLRERDDEFDFEEKMNELRVFLKGSAQQQKK